MSDQSQGPGWWLASDGKWYPPESAAVAESMAPPPGGPKRNLLWIALGVVVVVLGAGAVLLLAGSDGDDVADIDTSPFEPASFDDADALVDELGAQGIECEGFQERETVAPLLDLIQADSAGACTIDGVNLLVETYPGEGDGAANLEVLTDLADCEAGGEPEDGLSDFTTGGNWTVGANGATADDEAHAEVIDAVAAALQGDAIDIGCDS